MRSIHFMVDSFLVVLSSEIIFQLNLITNSFPKQVQRQNFLLLHINRLFDLHEWSFQSNRERLYLIYIYIHVLIISLKNLRIIVFPFFLYVFVNHHGFEWEKNKLVRVYVYEKKGKRKICFLYVVLKIVCVKTATTFFSLIILLTINKLIKFQ